MLGCSWIEIEVVCIVSWSNLDLVRIDLEDWMLFLEWYMFVVFVCCEVNRFVYFLMFGVFNCFGDSCVIVYFEMEVVLFLKYFIVLFIVVICVKLIVWVESEKYFFGFLVIVWKL